MFKRFRQIRKLNNSKLVDDEVYEKDANGRGIIDVGAENYEDIFSYYDLNNTNVLDWEFEEFLDAKADAIPMSEELALHFHVKDATEQKCEEIDKAIKDSYKRKLKAINRQMHRNTMFSIYMLILAVVAFAIYIPLAMSNVHFAIVEVFDIVAWVFVWEAVDNHFLTRRNLQKERLKKYRFIRADIEVLEYKRKSNTVKSKQYGIKKVKENNANRTQK